MAIYHLSAQVVQRSKGHSALAAAAYRAGETLHEARTGQQHDYSRKRGVAASLIIAPENAPEWVYNREELWNKAEAAERQRDGQPAREIRIALPHELTDGQRGDLVFDFVNNVFVKNGMVADVSIHRPDRHGDNRNHHAHILLTMRELDGEEFSTRKQREWNTKAMLETWREEWEAYQNSALEDAERDARVDHRTLEKQGVYRKATQHLGKGANALERRGEKTDRGDKNRAIAEQNRTIDRLVNERAAFQAELAQELEKEFMPPAPEPEPEITPSFPAPEEKAEYPPTVVTQEEPPPAMPAMSWQERKRRMQSPFAEETMTKRWESEIRERGEIREYGLGRKWYNRTIAMFENLYYGTIVQAKDMWQRYVTNRGERSRDREREDIEPER